METLREDFDLLQVRMYFYVVVARVVAGRGGKQQRYADFSPCPSADSDLRSASAIASATVRVQCLPTYSWTNSAVSKEKSTSKLRRW